MANNVLELNVKPLSSTNKPPVPANVKRVADKLSTLAVPACAWPGVVTLLANNVLELNVKPLLSLNRPLVPANVTRPAVKLPTVTVLDVDNVSAVMFAAPISPALNAPKASRDTIVPASLFGVASLAIVTTPVLVLTLIP